MFRSFFTITFRNLARNRLFTAINIVGLAIGLCCLLLASMFIYDEYTFDAHNRNADRIFRVVVDFRNDRSVINWARSSAAIAHYLAGNYPEIERVVRIRKNPATDLYSNRNVSFYEGNIFFADSSIFDVFDIGLHEGNPRQALSRKNSIILTPAIAKKYFPDSDPVGQIIRFNNQVDLIITGIMKPMPANAHFVADGFISFSTLYDLFGENRLMHWGQFDHHTYLLLDKSASAPLLEKKFPDFLKRYAPAWVPEKETLLLQPLLSIHLHSDLKDEIAPNSSPMYSYVIGTIACFIILMAFANFINLSTAMHMARFKEIGIQKILGANTGHLALYSWMESAAVCIIAFIGALALAGITLPSFNLATGKQMMLQSNYWLVLGLLMIVLVIASAGAVFPALQSLRYNLAAKTHAAPGRRSLLRSSLVTFQFFVSILLITITLTVNSQSTFLEKSRIGFMSRDLITVPIKDRSQNDRHLTIVREIESLPGVERACFSSSTPGSDNAFTYTYTFPGTQVRDHPINTFIVDHNFPEVYGITLREGKLLDAGRNDTLVDVLLNEAAVKLFGLAAPIGQLVTGKVRGRVVGVVNDFNVTSLRSAIEPVIIYSFPATFRIVSVKLREGDHKPALANLGKKWPELYPGYPLEYGFLDSTIQQLHASEIQLMRGYRIFSLIALTISGIGLVGLTAYSLRRRFREISIRKVFGSSTGQIISWIYAGNAKMILIASALAWVAGYYLMQKWLEGFAHKVSMEFRHFLLPSLIVSLVVLVATGLQSFQAARVNPAESLREE